MSRSRYVEGVVVPRSEHGPEDRDETEASVGSLPT